MNTLNEISEIKHFLFLSGISVIKPDPLKKLGIQYIVNVTTEENTPHVPGADVYRLRVDDLPSANLGAHFHSVADRIRTVKERGERVLVHCMAGVSRSASLVIAYLIKYEHMTLRQAYFYVKSIRPVIRPNLGFWRQLVDFEKRTRGVASVNLIPTELAELPLPDVYSSELRRANIHAKPVTKRSVTTIGIPVRASSIPDRSSVLLVPERSSTLLPSRTYSSIGRIPPPKLSPLSAARLSSTRLSALRLPSLLSSVRVPALSSVSRVSYRSY